jgi:predicted nucleotidyltransferase
MSHSNESRESAHWCIINEVVREKAKDPDVVAINIFGSVAAGRERPDSDVDIEIVTASEQEWRMEKEERYGIVVDYDFCSRRWLEDKAARYPFLSYVNTKEKPVFDPLGVMARIQDDLRRYYAEHPEVASYWEDAYALMRKNKQTGTVDPQGGVKAYDEAERLFSEMHSVTRDFWRE